MSGSTSGQQQELQAPQAMASSNTTLEGSTQSHELGEAAAAAGSPGAAAGGDEQQDEPQEVVLVQGLGPGRGARVIRQRV